MKMTRITAFFLTTAWLLAMLVGGVAGGLASTPDWQAIEWPVLTPVHWVIALLVLAALALLLSRSRIVLGVGERGLGWGGLARWVAYGLFAGALVVMLGAWLEQLPPVENRVLRSFVTAFETLGQGAVFVLFYGLLFRRWPFSKSMEGRPGWDVSDLFNNSRAARWTMLLGGLLIFLAGALVLFTNIEQRNPATAGGMLVGLSMFLLGLLDGPLRRWSRALSTLVVVTGLIGLILMVAWLFI